MLEQLQADTRQLILNANYLKSTAPGLLLLEQQHYLVDLLESAKSKNIGSIRTPISISRFIKLKVGDTFRFLIAHEQRHFVQIENVLTALIGITNKFPATHSAILQ